MPDVIAQVTIQAGRETFPPGSVVPIATEAEARKLYERGHAEPAYEEEAPAADPVVEYRPGEAEADGASEVENETPDRGETFTPLPDDFPGAATLAEAGINTIEDLVAAGNLTDIPGIGPARAAKIREALEG